VAGMLWLELAKGWYRVGEVVKVGIFARGFADLPAGAGERRFKLWAVNPSGVFRELQVAPGGGSEVAAVEFLPGEPGVYTVAAAITGDVNFSARAYFCVEIERNVLPPPGDAGLTVGPVWHEGSYLDWPVCLELRFNGERLSKVPASIFPGLWRGEKFSRFTDGAGQLFLDGRNWCYWQHGDEKKKGMVFAPWGVNWLVLAEHSDPTGRRHVATCTFCPAEAALRCGGAGENQGLA